MSTLTDVHVALGRTPRWDEVEPGFHVGSRDGEFVGFIDTTAVGSFVAFDGRSTPVGCYSSLRDAQRAVTGIVRAAEEPATRLTHVAQIVATAWGAAAVVLLFNVGALFLPR